MITNEELLDTVRFETGDTDPDARIRAVVRVLDITPTADGWADDDADEIYLALANGLICDNGNGTSLRAVTAEEHGRSDRAPGGEFIDTDGRKVYVRTID